ncbi:MAG: quinolinate synthase NadA [bacterium JZ-2024 1]
MSRSMTSLSAFRYLFTPLPEEYRHMNSEERRERTWQAKRTLGKDLVILAHNYQNDSVVEFADHIGDSYQLSVWSTKAEDARYIIFCGVSFMAETAYILNEGKKTVILPSMEASCPMAGMAERVQVDVAWEIVTSEIPEDDILPIVYINSYADLKAFAGIYGGMVCTSSNAERAFRWALDRGKRIFFFPDKNMGINMARRLGFLDNSSVIWNPWSQQFEGDGALTLADKRFFHWLGFCQVHDRFRVEHIEEVRQKYPGIRVLVHPECLPEVVARADEIGSTSYIVKRVEEASPGTKWAIGTEFHLVNRLKRQHPGQFIIPLGCEVCIDCNAMQQIQPEYLLWVMERLLHGDAVNQVMVDDETMEWARVALDRMLTL